MGYIQTLPNLLLSLIDLRSSSVIAISDLSTYFTVPSSGSVALQITAPGEQVASNVTFVPQSVNVYKCVDLGITCGDDACTPLPDGIYQVQYTVVGPTQANASPTTPTTINQKFIKIDQIKCKYQHAFLRQELSCDGYGRPCQNTVHHTGVQAHTNHPWGQGPAGLDKLRQIKLYIDGSVAECNKGNYAASYEYYTIANTMLDKMGCNKVVTGGLWCTRPVVCDIC